MRNQCLTLALFTLLSFPAKMTAQSPVDSLLAEFSHNPKDSMKWLALTYISEYYAKENIDSAIRWAHRSHDFARQNMPKLTPRSLNNLGLYYMNRGAYDRAIEYNLQALEAGKQYDCQPCIATTTGNLGIIAYYKRELDKAERYFREAISMLERLKIRTGEARYFNNLGLVQLDQSLVDEAEQSFQTALRLLEEADTITLQPTIYSNLGNAAYARGKFPEALDLYRESFAFAEKMHDEPATFLGLLNSGWAYYAMKNYEEAIRYFAKSKEVAAKIRHDLYLGKAYASLADAYKAKGDFPNAFLNLEKYQQVHDTLTSRLNNKAVMELETRYLTQQKEAELIRQQLALEQQTNEKRLILGAAFALVLILFGFFQYVRNRQRLREKEAAHALALESAAGEKLRELDRVKSSFFANISHEFRTPLTLISGPVKKWLEGAPEAPVQVPARELRVLDRNADRLLELVNQMLDLSRLESGRMKLQVAKNDLNQVLRALAYSFESMAAHQGIRYIVNVPNQPDLAWFDRDKLEKVGSNLLSNALKYTPNGGTVQFSAQVTEQWLYFTVADTGPGIGTEDRDKIFDRFYRVEGTEDYGTGIGLALVKELCALQHGFVEVQSVPGEGSVFQVRIPVGRDAFDALETTEAIVPRLETIHRQTYPGAATTQKGEATQADSRPICLVVEDNRDVQEFIREQLEGPFRVLLAKNGRDGLVLATEQIPDLIVSDVMMPEMDGTELCLRLKSDERTSHIPLILLTAKADQASKLEGLETGADDYLTKPFDARELLVRAQNLIAQREKLRKQFSRTVILKPQEIALSSTDEKFLQRIQKTLDEHLGNEQFNVEELASATGLSRSQLHRKLTALIDQSPVEFIRNFRLRRAKEMLEAGWGNVSEICYEVGFNSPAYFSKVFKDAFGITPSEVRI